MDIIAVLVLTASILSQARTNTVMTVVFMEDDRHGREAKQKPIRTEEAIHESEEKFRDLIENIYDWVWEADRNLVLTYSNPRIMDYLGYTPGEVLGRLLYDFMAPEKAKFLAAILESSIKRHKKYDFAQKTLISKRGEPVDFEMTVSLRYAEDGALMGFRGICRNVTERIRAEEALYKAYGELEKRIEERTSELVRARATLQSILDTAPIGIFVVDAGTNRITFTSIEAEKMFGGPLTGAIFWQKNYSYQFLQPDRSPIPTGDMPSYLSLKYGKRISNMEILVRRADGSEFTILSSSAPIKDPGGHITAVVVTVVDITKLKSTENELLEAKAQAEMYLDLMGHDINNLNQAGIGYLELVQDELRAKGKLEIKDQLYIDKALETQVNSSKLIDNVRKLQRLKAGGLKHRPIDLCAIVSELKDYYSRIPDRTVKISFTPVEHCCVIANELIRDVFSNLIGNAIKHSSPDKLLEVDIGIKKVTIKDNNFFEVTIEDNGPGIPDELKSRLFTRFQRGTTKTSGRGLGLYLAKTLLEDFNGKVSVEDRVAGDYRKGSRFVVLLPAASNADTCQDQ
jgi:PAS domain S-box-containing protein